MRHIWFDPGETTGWAQFEDETPFVMGELKYGVDLFSFLAQDLLQDITIDLIGIENYRLRPKGHERGWTPTWSEVIPIRVIGAIEAAAWNLGIKSIFQEPDIKPAGYGYANLGKYDPNKKGMHMQDAIAHGSFYWMEEHCAVNRQPRNPQSRRVQRSSRPGVARPNYLPRGERG